MTDIALVFINWNTGALTVGAVQSLLRHPATEYRFHLLIVDNDSSDDSLALFERELRPLTTAHPDLFSGFTVKAMDQNLGFAKAVNAGLATVEAPFAIVLNTDVEFLTPAPVQLIEALQQHDSAALACPRLLRPDGSEQTAVTPLPSPLTELTNRSLARRMLLQSLPADQVTEVPSVVGPCMAVHMERLRDVGFLDVRFFFFFEETDWCYRINQAGYTILYVPKAEIIHLQGASANRRPYRARVQFYQSRYRYFAKHYGVPITVLLGIGLGLRLTLNVMGMLLLSILSLGKQKFRDKLMVYGLLWTWHLCLCRPQWGFEPK